MRTHQIVISTLVVLIVFRVLAGIVFEYQWYFPPNFQSSGFLTGRESFFVGSYRIAFYLHIVCGPIVILIGMFLYWSGKQRIRISTHRFLGHIQFLLIVIILAPSGFVLATRAHTGYIAGIGFALLSVATLVTATLAVTNIKRCELDQHWRWASRLMILLLSPILLRIMSGTVVTLGIDSPEWYQFSAWASWLAPLLAFEIWLRVGTHSINEPFHPSQELGHTPGNQGRTRHEKIT